MQPSKIPRVRVFLRNALYLERVYGGRRTEERGTAARASVALRTPATTLLTAAFDDQTYPMPGAVPDDRDRDFLRVTERPADSMERRLMVRRARELHLRERKVHLDHGRTCPMPESVPDDCDRDLLRMIGMPAHSIERRRKVRHARELQLAVKKEQILHQQPEAHALCEQSGAHEADFPEATETNLPLDVLR